jgi:hypothetical protein
MTMSKKIFWLVILLVGSSLIFLGYAIGGDWGQGARYSVALYSFFVTIFLAAQLWGFVVSQMTYVESIERAKFELLEVEGISCKKNT